jgi:Zn-dependent M28 family amino/carboxypeptidase
MRDGSGVFARLQALRALKPALLVMVDRTGRFTRSGPARRLVDPEDRAAGAPWVSIRSGELAKAVHAQAAGAAVSVRLEASKETPVKLRNVVGLLRGSDPVLKDTYVLVTAHYDHVGVKPNCTTGDCIYNGANDDGSGTVSVIEIANALASMKERPRRSIVFMTVFGEEKGGYGSRYYARHPIFPLEKTVADVNLEQLGRTDASDGPQVGTATFTGFEFSNLPAIFAAAGRFTGVKVYKSGPSDDYFSRSDNQMFADAGIPAHTMSVAYEFPDYHGVGDSWDKIDYANMAKVDRMLALGIVMLADGDAPRWNEANPKTAPYVSAWKKLHGGSAAAAGK